MLIGDAASFGILRRIIDSTKWVTSLASLFLWSLVLFHMVLILVGMSFDADRRRRKLWNDEHFLVDHPDLSDPPPEKPLDKMKTKLAEAQAKLEEVPLFRRMS